MIKDELFDSFLEYLSLKDIVLVEDFKDKQTKSDNIDEEAVLKQLLVISEFDKRVMGYKGYMGKRLDNKTGSVVEQYKVNIKRLKRYLKNIRMNSAASNFERVILKKGNDYLKRAESCISEIYNAGYMDIIQRSMKNTEICLGNVDFSNLRKTEKIEIISIDKCCYNNIEMDCFNLLSKHKRKGAELDWKLLTEKFCEYADLSESSSRFILALLSYPYEFMKCCNRYREKSKDWSEKEYEERLERALLKDGEILL
ncbi:spore coat protein [Clostridium sp. SYSU_GA19001]|uniref:spore coat protein n=1 Tax=Clostridium caldaquaticum TaxID=2940653 RepID=UPI002076FA03|nr:spore coat protein [Clostridium caldaquaticum]MCM8709665.1 spore coat protein [Clostridium caldaquaticum]